MGGAVDVPYKQNPALILTLQHKAFARALKSLPAKHICIFSPAPPSQAHNINSASKEIFVDIDTDEQKQIYH